MKTKKKLPPAPKQRHAAKPPKRKKRARVEAMPSMVERVQIKVLDMLTLAMREQKPVLDSINIALWRIAEALEARNGGQKAPEVNTPDPTAAPGHIIDPSFNADGEVKP